MPGLCPHCNQLITWVSLEGMTASVAGGAQWRAVSYLCPLCRKIISVGIDPISVKTEILDAIRKDRA